MEGNGRVPDKREMILREATRLFRENGYDNTSIRELADATNLSAAGIYYFFQDKEDILYTILKQHSEELIETVERSIDREAEPEASLRQMIRSLLLHNVHHVQEVIILNREIGRLSSERQQLIRQASRKAYDLVKDEFFRFYQLGRMKKEDLALASFTLLSETTWFGRWYRDSGTSGIDYFADRISDMFLKGLIAPEKTQEKS